MTGLVHSAGLRRVGSGNCGSVEGGRKGENRQEDNRMVHQVGFSG